MKVFIKYGFIFDPSQTWAQLNEFESSLAAFFRERGFEAEMIKTIDSQEKIKLLFISKSTLLPQETEPPKEESIKKQISNLTKKRDFNGQYKK